MKNSNRIALIGGSGKAGRHVVQQLIDNQIPCKLLIRSPEKQPPPHPLVQVIIGDARNYTDVERLLENCTTVISTIGSRKGEVPVLHEASRNMVKAMKFHGIERLIALYGTTLSVPGDQLKFQTRFSNWLLGKLFPKVVRDKQSSFEILQQSELRWTAIRIPLLHVPGQKAPVRCSTTTCPGSKLSAVNLATFIIRQLTDDAYIQQAPFVAN